ncbi:MAG: AraC family transcriptional regulator [Mycetocola sp.]
MSVPERVHHGDAMVLWQVRGSAEAVLDGVSYALVEGGALWLPAGTHHVLHVHENSVLLPMFFDAAAVATTMRVITDVSVDDELRTLFLAYIQSEQTIIRPDVDIARQILSMIERRPAPATTLVTPSAPAAAAIAELLRFNPGDSRSTEELAAAVHTSLRTIERAFKTETGLTLRAWRIHNRMESAADLLRTVHSITAVAHRVGYSDVSAFRRVFRGHFGCAPREYVARYVR